jgi:hypothetical protein
MRLTNASAPPLRCNVCGAPAKSRCGGCLVTLYCSAQCQAGHWSVHKRPCRVDRRDTSEAEAVYTINHKCRHGGPDIEHNPALMASLQASMGVISTLPPQNAPLELRLFCAFARATPPHPLLHRILLSCGVDALADRNYGNARMFCRFAALCSGVARRPALLAELEAGLVALGSGAGAGGGSEHVAALAGEVAALASHTGLLAALRRHMTCGCLEPRSASALPLAEALGDEGVQGEAGGEGGGSGVEAAAPSAGGALPAGAALPVGGVEAMSVKQLKAALAERGIPTAGLLEKADLQGALRAALG